MTPGRVVADASTILKWFMQSEAEDDRDQALALKDQAYEGKIIVEVPAFFWLEAANILARDLKPVEGLRALKLLLETDPGVAFPRLEKIYEMVQNEITCGFKKATVYDMFYVELALFRQCTLVSADGFQLSMAQRAGAKAMALRDFY